MSKNGHAILGHIPKIIFLAYKKHRGWLRVHEVSKVDNAYNASTLMLLVLLVRAIGQISNATKEQRISLDLLKLEGAALTNTITYIHNTTHKYEKTQYYWYRKDRYAFHFKLIVEYIDALE